MGIRREAQGKSVNQTAQGVISVKVRQGDRDSLAKLAEALGLTVERTAEAVMAFGVECALELPQNIHNRIVAEEERNHRLLHRHPRPVD